MLFKNEMVDLIDQDKKTATRRLSTKKFYKVGSIQPVQRNYYDKAKVHIKILKRYTQKLRYMSNEDAIAEGFKDRSSYFTYLAKINKKSLAKIGIVDPIVKCAENEFSDYRIDPKFLDLEPTVYEFKRLKLIDCSFPQTTNCPECSDQKACHSNFSMEYNDP